MEVLAASVLLGLIPAFIARSKGRSFAGWWIFGVLLFIVALPASLLIRKDPASSDERLLKAGYHRKCPHCAEVIKVDASVCRWCGQSSPAQERPAKTDLDMDFGGHDMGMGMDF